MLLGTCDDLSIPRPLGPIRDLVGSVSPALEEALSGGAAPHDDPDAADRRARAAAAADGARARGRALGGRRDARRDHGARAADRLAARAARADLPRRRGAARPSALRGRRRDPRRRLGGPRARAALGARGRVARRRARGRGVRRDRGEPVLRHRAARLAEPSVDLPPSIANAVLGRASRLDDDSRRLVELVSVVPSRVRDVGCWTPSCRTGPRPRWSPSDGSCSRSARAYVRFRHELARHAIRSSIPIAARRRLHAEILEALLAEDADPADIVHHAEAAGAEDVVCRLRAHRGASSGGGGVEPARRTRSTGAPSSFVDRLPAPELATVFEELATRGIRRRPARGRVRRDRARDRDLRRARRRGGRRPLHARPVALPLGRGRRRRRAAGGARGGRDPRAARPLGRARPRLQRRLPARDARGGRRAGARLGGAGARRSRPGSATSGHARTRSSTSAAPGSTRMGAPPRSSRRTPSRDAAGDRHEAARALDNLGYSLMCWVRPDEALRYAQQAAAYGTGHELFIIASYAATVDRLAAAARRRLGRGRAPDATRDRERHGRPAARQDGLAELAVRRGDPDAAERLAELGARGRSHRRAAADRAGRSSSPTEWALTTRRADADRAAREARRRDPPRGRLSGRYAMRVAAWAAVAGIDVEVGTPMSPPHAAMAAARLARGGRRLRRGRLVVRPGADAVAARRRGVARRGDRDRPRPRRRAADAGASPARMRELGIRVPARAAGGDARQPGRADGAPARGARAARSTGSRTPRSPTGSSSRRERPSTTSPPC